MKSLLAELQEALVDTAEKPPKHLRTVASIAEQEGMSESAVRVAVRKLLAAKKWVRKPYKVYVDGVKGLRPVNHYGPVKPVA